MHSSLHIMHSFHTPFTFHTRFHRMNSIHWIARHAGNMFSLPLYCLLFVVLSLQSLWTFLRIHNRKTIPQRTDHIDPQTTIIIIHFPNRLFDFIIAQHWHKRSVKKIFYIRCEEDDYFFLKNGHRILSKIPFNSIKDFF